MWPDSIAAALAASNSAMLMVGPSSSGTRGLLSEGGQQRNSAANGAPDTPAKGVSAADIHEAMKEMAGDSQEDGLVRISLSLCVCVC
jgi:hypothetical protein